MSDKERERLLYPGRVNLTSELSIHPSFMDICYRIMML